MKLWRNECWFWRLHHTLQKRWLRAQWLPRLRWKRHYRHYCSLGSYLSDKELLIRLPIIEWGFIKPGKHVNNVFITVMRRLYKEMFHLNRNLNKSRWSTELRQRQSLTDRLQDQPTAALKALCSGKEGQRVCACPHLPSNSWWENKREQSTAHVGQKSWNRPLRCSASLSLCLSSTAQQNQLTAPSDAQLNTTFSLKLT